MLPRDEVGDIRTSGRGHFGTSHLRRKHRFADGPDIDHQGLKASLTHDTSDKQKIGAFGIEGAND
jgi:hypothetical protein